jgi:hypothetical protein
MNEVSICVDALTLRQIVLRGLRAVRLSDEDQRQDEGRWGTGPKRIRRFADISKKPRRLG